MHNSQFTIINITHNHEQKNIRAEEQKIKSMHNA